MAERIDRIEAALDRVLVGIGVIGITISTLIAFISVILRYCFHISFEVFDEICRYSIMTGAYLCGGPLIRTNGHVALDVLSAKLKGKAKLIHQIISALVAAVVGAMVCKWGIDLVLLNKMTGITSASTTFKMWIVYTAIPVGMALVVIFALLEAVKAAVSLADPNYTGEPALEETVNVGAEKEAE